MTKAVQRRRGTNAEHSSFTGLEGELSVNTTNDSVHVHDGATAGGFELARADGSNVGNFAVGGDLDVTGNVTIGGNITLGDADTDGITVNADLTSSLIPNADDTYDLGSASKQWRNLYVDGAAEIDSLSIDGTVVTATAAELNVLDGITATVTELNYTDGVTSAIQTQLDAKAPIDAATFTGTTTIPTADINGGTIDGVTIGGSSAGAGTFTTFTSTGIDDNASATAVTIDGSGSVGIGTSSPSYKLDVSGTLAAGATTATGVGDVISLDQSATGSATYMTFDHTVETGGKRFRVGHSGAAGSTFTDWSIYNETDNVVMAVFKGAGGLVLPSSGVYLGGTAAANLLDDYEEGTWTPVVKDGGSTTITATVNSATYTKIGRLVYVQTYVTRNDATAYTGDLVITGLPYNVASGTNPMNGNVWIDNSSTDYMAFCYGNSTNIYLKTLTIGDYLKSNNWENNRPFYMSFTYET